MSTALISAAAPVLERAMRFRVARQGLLAANLANADTPGYRRVDLSFDEALGRAGSRLQRTHAGHAGGELVSQEGFRVTSGPRGSGPDGNGVELQREIVAANRNAGAFTDQAAVLSRLLMMTRVAVTGEAR